MPPRMLSADAVQDLIYGGDGDQFFEWNSNLGNATYHGGDLGENYDTNPYMDRTGGDSLFITDPLGVRVRFNTTEDGFVQAGKQRLDFTGMERLHLGDGNDTVVGGQAQINAPHGSTPAHGLTIYAGGGDDHISGTSADDIIDGGAGNDKIWAGAGDDFIQSSTGNDLIYGGAGNDNIRWGQGNFNEVVGNDTIYGGAGHDLINVWIKDGYTENGKGVNVYVHKIFEDGAIKGSAITDLGGERSKLIFQGFEQGWTHEGKDVVSGRNAEVIGDAGMHWNTRWGDDVLVGTSGNDTLEGGDGRDTITGGAGDDLISANQDYYRGADAQGDGDVDVIIFNFGHGNDTVIGFDADIDILRIQDRGSYTATQTDEGTLLESTRGDSILLAGIDDYIL